MPPSPGGVIGGVVVFVIAVIVATGNILHLQLYALLLTASPFLSLSPTLLVSIALSLLFGPTGLVVGVVIVICTKKLRSKSSASVELSGARPVGEPVYEDVGAGFEPSTIPEPIHEYEEIILKETKHVDVQLTDNAAIPEPIHEYEEIRLKETACGCLVIGASLGEPHTSESSLLPLFIICVVRTFVDLLLQGLRL